MSLARTQKRLEDADRDLFTLRSRYNTTMKTLNELERESAASKDEARSAKAALQYCRNQYAVCAAISYTFIIYHVFSMKYGKRRMKWPRSSQVCSDL